MGTETEYGITTPSDPLLSPLITSTHAVVAYAALHTSARFRWDYEEEHPLQDARGFDLRRYRTVPIVDPNGLGVANVVTHNGARFYVDHGHPEYSSPEVTNAWDAMIYDAAGDIYMQQAVASVEKLSKQGTSVLKGKEPCPPLKIYKNNVDGKGQSYGSHENYQCSRQTDFNVLTRALIPFFVTRQIITGAGRVGIGTESQQPGFQISQRADYFEQEISLETTLNRGIVNTRDEPHADAEKYRRLHVIIGDANMSQYSNFMKIGMTKLVLDGIESGIDFSDLTLVGPVDELRNVSRDLTCTHHLRLADGRELSAIEVLQHYRERLTGLSSLDEIDHKVLDLWEELLDDLTIDPLRTADRLDWTAKWSLIRSFLQRGVALDDPKLQAIDIQYADIDPTKSLYHALVRKQRMRRLVDDATIEDAVQHPPHDTRAYFRGRVCEKFGASIVAASWQSLTLQVGQQQVRINLDQCKAWTQPATKQLIDDAKDSQQLLEGLGYEYV